MMKICIALALIAITIVALSQTEGVEDRNTPKPNGHDCDPTICESDCVDLGYQEGLCIGGRCRCTDWRNAKVAGNHSADCDQYACEEGCMLEGFTGGTCISNNKCICYDFLNKKGGDPAPAPNKFCNKTFEWICWFQCKILHGENGRCMEGKMSYYCYCFNNTTMAN